VGKVSVSRAPRRSDLAAGEPTIGRSRAGRAGARCSHGYLRGRSARSVRIPSRISSLFRRGLRQLSNSTSSRSSPRVPPRAAPGLLAPARSTYVFITGIGPTSVTSPPTRSAKAFGVPIDTDPRARHPAQMGGDDWRRDERDASAHDAHPQGCGPHSQQGVRSAWLWIGNVIVMAGVPSIMQAILDEVAPKLKIGVRMLSKTVRAELVRATSGCSSARSLRPIFAVAIGRYPFFDPQHGPNTNVVLRARNAQKLAQAKRAVEGHAGASAAST
jgi:molybdopterin-biosynthesis enzyme MoeA-like protein